MADGTLASRESWATLCGGGDSTGTTRTDSAGFYAFCDFEGSRYSVVEMSDPTIVIHVDDADGLPKDNTFNVEGLYQ
jgi:hypothetical protein